MNVNPIVYKKKHHYGWLIALIIILVILLLPIALAYILLYDNSTKELNIDSTMTTTAFVESYKEKALVNSVENTKDTGKVGLSLSENDINTLVNCGMKENMDATVAQYVTKAYLDVDTTARKYNFYVDAGLPFFPYFKSRARLSAEIENLTGTEKGFQIKFSDAGVGRLNGLLGLVDQFVGADLINNLFKNTGLSFTVDWANHTIKYSISNLLTDFKLVENNNDNVFLSLVNEIFTQHQNLLDLDFYTNKGVDVAINLASAHDANAPAPVSFDQTIAKVREEFKTATITDANEITTRFDEISKNEVTPREKPEQGKDIQQVLEDNKSVVTQTTYITEDELNSYFRGTDIVGKAFPLYAKDATTGENKINFIIINDFRSDILSDNNIKITANISINGYDTQLTIDATIANHIQENTGGGYTLRFTMNNICYGNEISLWDETNNKPKDFVSSLIENGFSVGGAATNITIEGSDILIKVDGEAGMYGLANEITTSEDAGGDKLNIQVFVPQFYYGEGVPDASLGKANDMYLDTTNLMFYTKETDTVWGAGQSVLDPTWQANNPDIVALLTEMGLIPTI